jgi:DNA-binding MarR family transcriptional regulator
MPRAAERIAALDRVLELAVLVNEDMTSSLAARGLTEARTHVIWLVHARGPVTQRDLAEALRVSPRNVTGLVDALEQTGFVRRAPHPTDRRATLVELTNQGREAAERLVDEQSEFARLLFDRMPRATFDGLVAGLDAVLGRLRPAVEETRVEEARADG